MSQAQNPIIHVVLADDHQLLREGIKRIIDMEPDMQVVGECGDGIQAIELCNALRPHVILMDINMPIENGVVATERMRDLLPEVKVIILSIHDDESYVFETLRKGASGYLLKDMEASELLHAIRSVVQGYAYIHPKVTGKLINQMRHMMMLQETEAAEGGNLAREGGVLYKADPESPLTRRENEVLKLLAEGMSNRAIGEKLTISEKTVKNHVSSILQKLDVEDRTQAVLDSIKRGWVTL